MQNKDNLPFLEDHPYKMCKHLTKRNLSVAKI